MSNQAPNGYIRINKAKYLDILRTQWQNTSISAGSTEGAGKLADKSFLTPPATFVRTLSPKQAAPVDTGQLSEAIELAKVGDPLLTTGSPDSDGTGTEFVIESGEWL